MRNNNRQWLLCTFRPPSNVRYAITLVHAADAFNARYLLPCCLAASPKTLIGLSYTTLRIAMASPLSNGMAFAEVLTPTLATNGTLRAMQVVRRSVLAVPSVLVSVLICFCCGACVWGLRELLRQQRQLQAARYMEQEQPLMRQHRSRESHEWREWRHRALLARILDHVALERDSDRYSPNARWIQGV